MLLQLRLEDIGQCFLPGPSQPESRKPPVILELHAASRAELTLHAKQEINHSRLSKAMICELKTREVAPAWISRYGLEREITSYIGDHNCCDGKLSG